jgi:hypothetical protein
MFLQLTSAARAGFQSHWYSYGRLGDLLRAGRLPEGEGALTRLTARALGLLGSGALGEGGGLPLCAPLELLVFSNQGRVAGSQLCHLLLQRSNLALQLSHQGQQVFPAQR